MGANLIANRYAKALLSNAGPNNATAEQYASFLDAAASLFDIPDAKRVLISPVMPAALKTELLELARVRSKTTADVEKFSLQLIDSGRVALIPEISATFRLLLDERRGVAHAVVTTAEPLEAGIKTNLQETLSTVFKKSLTIDNKVNRRVLGGLVVEVGNFALDLSVRAKLDALAEHAKH